MKDFCSIAVTHNHDDHQQNTGHCLKANSKRPPLSSKLPAIITQSCATVHRNAKSSGKMEIHKTLMKDLQYEEARDDIGWCKTVKVVVEVFLIIIITTCLAESFVTSYRRPLKLRSYYLGLPTWNWIVLIMEIVCGLSIIRFITFVVILLIKKHQTLRPGKYVLFFATELKMRSAVTVWFGLVFLTWLFWLRPRIKLTSDDAHEAVHYITTSLLCLLLGSISLLLKDMLCLRLEADLHFYQFFGRIRDTILDLHGIRIIHEKEKWKFLKYKKKNLWMEVHQMEQKTIPIWILKRLVELYIRDIENKPLGEIDNHATKDDQELLEGAQKMFESIVRSSNGEHPDYISRENLQKTYFKDNEDELNYLFKVLKKRERPDGEPTQKEANTSQLPWEKEITGEQKEEEQIDRAQFLSWAFSTLHNCFDWITGPGAVRTFSIETRVPQLNWLDRPVSSNSSTNQESVHIGVLAYKKCWGLQRTLHSSEVGFIKLNKLLSSFLILIMIAVWLLATNILSTSKLALLFSPLLASTFVFGHACKNMFEGLIFAFGMHPFDVGDRVVIDGMQMKVRKMNFLTTLFFKYDTQEEVIYPNSILAGKSICNLDIAPDQSDSLDFAIDAETPLEDIVDIENRIK
ncbi:hypothetical protein Ancab_029398, partial [Ancistrocladus abbreviatus]